MNDLKQDAADLKAWLLERAPSTRDHFSVAVGVDELHVYVRCSARQWNGEHTPRWNNRRVQWHFDCGVARAYG